MGPLLGRGARLNLLRRAGRVNRLRTPRPASNRQSRLPAVLPSRAVLPSLPSQKRRPVRRNLIRFAALAAGLMLAGVEIRHRAVALGIGTDRDAPSWIWRNHDLRHVQAAGFYAVKELDLVVAPPEAEIRILGDAEYLLTLNGVRIGSNRFVSGASLDRYRVERWLRPGRNRLVVELRSPSGAGGLSLELLAGGQQLVRTDGSWTVYEANWRGLFGDRPMIPGAPPRRLGRSPLGRWGTPPLGPQRPVFEAVLAAPAPLQAESYRISGGDATWSALADRERRPSSLGQLVEFDFGAERTGYLQLAYREGPGQRSSPGPSAVLIAFGDSPVGPPAWTADAIFQPIPGAGLYQDSTLRRFRYVAVAGLPGVFSAEVLDDRGVVERACAGRRIAGGDSRRPAAALKRAGGARSLARTRAPGGRGCRGRTLTPDALHHSFAALARRPLPAYLRAPPVRGSPPR